MRPYLYARLQKGKRIADTAYLLFGHFLLEALLFSSSLYVSLVFGMACFVAMTSSFLYNIYAIMCVYSASQQRRTRTSIRAHLYLNLYLQPYLNVSSRAAAAQRCRHSLINFSFYENFLAFALFAYFHKLLYTAEPQICLDLSLYIYLKSSV